MPRFCHGASGFGAVSDAESALREAHAAPHAPAVYSPVADQLAAHGIAAVVDLAAPERTLAVRALIEVIAAGPMLTHPGGYPLDAWGADGYGLGCGDPACVTAAIDRLAGNGARVIKLAPDDDGLDPTLIATAVSAAHGHHLKVAAHALTDAAAARAGAVGVDVLAHTPVEPLAETTIASWRGRAVIGNGQAYTRWSDATVSRAMTGIPSTLPFRREGSWPMAIA